MFTRGFLPPSDPLISLPPQYETLNQLGKELPKLLVNRRVRKEVIQADFPNFLEESDERVLERAFITASFLTHGYVFESEDVAQKIPENLSRCLVGLADKLGRLPVLSYASYALHNWRRLDPQEEISLNNLALLQNFLGGQDEDWFVMIHIQIEYQASKAVNAFCKWLENPDPEGVSWLLQDMLESLKHINATLKRMPEKCDPYIYYNRVRPYIFGWKNNPSLPNGIIYEGVWNEPKFFRGETGAQSTIIPCFDAVLGITHQDDPLKVYLLEMREYMPKSHRNFLERLEGTVSVREFVLKMSMEVIDLYNEVIMELSDFRSIHLQYAIDYIYSQSQKSNLNPTNVGTGGTPFVDYLRKHRDETRSFLIKV